MNGQARAAGKDLYGSITLGTGGESMDMEPHAGKPGERKRGLPDSVHKDSKESTRPITVGFVGNPNCGKTTLFNAFTGAKLKVANWPGVTVERAYRVLYASKLRINKYQTSYVLQTIFLNLSVIRLIKSINPLFYFS